MAWRARRRSGWFCSINRKLRVLSVCLFVALGWQNAARAHDFARLRVPFPGLNIALDQVSDITAAGEVVGFYIVASGTMHGYRWDQVGATETIDVNFPQAINTKINGSSDSGHLVGSFLVNDGEFSTGSSQGFVFDGTTFTALRLRDATETMVSGVNNLGVAVGLASSFQTSSVALPNVPTGFIFTNGSYATVFAPNGETARFADINDSGTSVGCFSVEIAPGSFRTLGFVRSAAGGFTVLDFGPGFNTCPAGINNSGLVVGTYHLLGGPLLVQHGFVWDGQTFHTRDFPGVDRTQITGVNDAGDLVGLRNTTNFVAQAVPGDPVFINTPPGASVDESSRGQLQAGEVADPINSYSGELYNDFPPDLNLGGPMPVMFQRYYASFLRRSSIVGDLGSNWRHNFDASLLVAGDVAQFVSSRGRVTNFSMDAMTGLWEQQTNFDTPYQLLIPVNQDAELYDPVAHRFYTFDLTSGMTVAGKLVTVEDGKGNIHSVLHDLASGNIQSISDGLGRTLSFTYNADTTSKISNVDGGMRSVSFEYTDAIDPEYLTRVTDVLGGLTTYTYRDTSMSQDDALMLNEVRPRLNVPFSQTFDSLGKVVTQIDSAGNTFSFDYLLLDTTMTDPLGNSRVHRHTSAGELEESEDQAGQVVLVGSTSTGQRGSITDRLGGVTTMSYDATSGLLTSRTHADASVTTIDYTSRVTAAGVTVQNWTGITHADGTTESATRDGSGNITSRTDQLGETAISTYNGSGQLLTLTNKIGGVRGFTYNADGTLATMLDPAGNATMWTHDAMKRPILITRTDGSTRGESLDDANQVLMTTDENGNTTTFSYNANGNLNSIQSPLGGTLSFDFDGNDRLVRVTDATGGDASVEFDPLGRIAAITDANGGVVRRDYDTRNHLTQVSDALNNIWSMGYDAEGIRTSSTDPLGNTTTFASDSLGRTTQVSSPLGNISNLTYDAMGRVTSATDGLGRMTTFSRDARGRISGIALPGGASSTSITRNALGRLASVLDPNGNAWSRNYDTSGRLTSSADPLGQGRGITYDNRNRPATITFPGTLGNQALTYDAVGNLTDLSYSDGVTPARSFVYDAHHRLVSSNAGGATPNSLTRAYDANDRIIDSNGISITRDAGGRVVNMILAPGKTLTYVYDSNDRLISVTDWVGGVTGFTFDNAGRLTAVARPNSVNTSNAWDGDSRLVGIIESGVSDISLVRDANDQIVSATRNVPQSASAATLVGRTETFDAASRIVGNTYDALGRRTAAGGDTFTWNGAGRMTGYGAGGVTATHAYDGLGRRTQRASATTSDFVWNDALGLPSISVEVRGGGDFRYFVHTPGGALLYSVDAVTNARHFYHFDEMGNTIFVTNDAGLVTDSYAYTPYGELITSTGMMDNPFTWQGEHGVVDEGNGLYLIRDRFYDSHAGRFISRDARTSIAPRRVNPYQYALNNPLRFVDVDGFSPEEAGRLKLSDFGHPPDGRELSETEVSLTISNVGIRDNSAPRSRVAAEAVAEPLLRFSVPNPFEIAGLGPLGEDEGESSFPSTLEFPPENHRESKKPNLAQPGSVAASATRDTTITNHEILLQFARNGGRGDILNFLDFDVSDSLPRRGQAFARALLSEPEFDDLLSRDPVVDFPSATQSPSSDPDDLPTSVIPELTGIIVLT